MLARMSLANVWKATRGEHEQPESCLEIALAAALECPPVLRRVAEAAGWTLPHGPYVVSTQDVVTEGRTDITLSWPGYRLVLELKLDEPPVAEQVEKYLIEGADVVAISVDSPFAQEAWAKTNNIQVKLASDLNKVVIKQYDVVFPMLAGVGDTAARAAFVIDKNGVVQYSEQTPTPKDLPNFDAIKATLAKLK